MKIIDDIANAILRGDKTFKSTSGMYSVKLPSPQTTGTMWQREACAYMDAQRIVNLKVHDLYPRVCDYSNKGMVKGYTNGDTYADESQTEALLKDFGLPFPFDEMNDLIEMGDFYYSEWECLEEDENFTSNGALIEMTEEMAKLIVY